MRSLGGSVGLSVGVIVFNAQIKRSDELAAVLSPDQMSALLKSPLEIAQLEPGQQKMVSEVFAKAFTQEMRVATYIATACFAASLLTIQRNRPQTPESSGKESGEP
jgi:hypothetical protein